MHTGLPTVQVTLHGAALPKKHRIPEAWQWLPPGGGSPGGLGFCAATSTGSRVNASANPAPRMNRSFMGSPHRNRSEDQVSLGAITRCVNRGGVVQEPLPQGTVPDEARDQARGQAFASLEAELQIDPAERA